MKVFLLSSLVLILSCNAAQQQTSGTTTAPVQGPVQFAASITADELKEHLYTYASDEFEGRETGSAGQKKAVEYLREAYSKLGVAAAMDDGSYFQKVPLEVSALPEGSLSIGDKIYELGEDFLTFSAISSSFEEVVYAGYGIEDIKYSNYDNLDVKDKVVLIKAGEPKNADGTYVISGSNNSSVWSTLTESVERKSQLLLGKGARAILYYDPANYQRYQRAFNFLAGNDDGRMSLRNDGGSPALILLTDELAREIYGEVASADSVQTLEVQGKFDIESRSKSVDSENVIAYVKGKSKPEEYVIISSHLDHIGVNDDGKINNGADDDGSGTVAMLEIAEAFKQAAEAGQGPERSVVFLHVTGEEKGLLGSEYYTDMSPVFPLSATIANLNIDMIGRTDPKRQGDPDYIYLIGSDKLSTELHQLSEDVNNAHTQLELDYTYNDENDPNRFYYRSDHYNFAKNNIPIIFYFNGTHDDYHRPTDTPDKIEYDLLAQRTKLIFHTAWELANRDERVKVDKASSR